MATKIPPKGMVGLFKQAWHLYPELVGSAGMAAVGMGLMYLGARNYYARDGDNRRYKHEYTVYRHDDPRVSNIRTDYFTD